MKSLSPKLKVQIDTSSPISSKKDLSNSYHIQTYSPHRRSPLIRSNSNERVMSPKSFESNNSNNNNNNNSMTRTEELLFEDTFRGILGSLKRILLQYQPHQDSNSSRDSRIEEHAQELINEEIRRTTTKMQNLQTSGPTYLDSKSHKIAAYSFLSAQLVDEIESLISQQDSMEALEKLRDQHDQVIQQYKALQNHSSYEKAILEQRILLLEQENKSLKEQVSNLSRKKGTLVFELEARNRMEDDAHAKYVQLHIQIVNYHTKINQLMGTLESSVKTRIGFMPRDIQNNIDKVRNLPAPGADILYTRRHQRSKSTELIRSKSLNSSDEIISTTPNNQTTELKDDLFSPSIEKMSQREFYQQLNKDSNEILTPKNKNQRNNFELNKSESFNTIDSTQFNIMNVPNYKNSYDRDNVDDDDLGIGGSIHERYDKYFQMKKNLVLNSQLKESQSNLLQTNLSPVNSHYHFNSSHTGNNSHNNNNTLNNNNNPEINNDNYQERNGFEGNKTIHVIATPITQLSPTPPPSSSSLSSSTPDIKYYTSPKL